MNYKLRFWDDLFKALIDIHLTNGNKFDGFMHLCENDAFVQLERLDYEAASPWPFLRYTFKSPEGGSVSYSVNNKQGGSGLDICISLVRDTDDYIHLLSEPNPRAEQIMLQCYLFAVKQMATIWYN